MLPKLSRILKIEDLNTKSKRRSPDERTSGGDVRKRVAIGHAIAAETRLWPHFRGHLDEVGYGFSWKSCTGTLLPISPINTPIEQQRGGIQRMKLRVLFRFFLFPKFLVFSFLLFEKEHFEEGEELCNWSVTSKKRLLILLCNSIQFFYLD